MSKQSSGTMQVHAQQTTSTKKGAVNHMEAALHSGPLPPAETYAAYEATCPGAADRLLRMAEQEGEHRRALERVEERNFYKITSRAQWFGFTISSSLVAIAVFLILAGKDVAGFLSMTAGVIPQLIAFISQLAKKRT